MRERVALLGGRFEIRSYPQSGSGNGTSTGTGVGVPIGTGVKTIGNGVKKRLVDRKRAGRGTKILIRLPVAQTKERVSRQ
jgi:hypothetical protein